MQINTPEGPWERYLGVIHRIEDIVLSLLLGAMILLASGQILLRNAFDTGLIWADPLLRIMVLWLGLLGALAASRTEKHIAIDILPATLSATTKIVARVATSLFVATVCVTIAWHAGRFVYSDYQAQSIAFAGVPVWWFELIIPFAFGMMAIRYLLHSALYLQRWRSHP